MVIQRLPAISVVLTFVVITTTRGQPGYKLGIGGGELGTRLVALLFPMWKATNDVRVGALCASADRRFDVEIAIWRTQTFSSTVIAHAHAHGPRVPVTVSTAVYSSVPCLVS